MKLVEQPIDDMTRCGPAGAGDAVDMAALLGRERFNDLLRQFEALLNDFLARLSEQPWDIGAIRRQAHALVASAGMFGFDAVSECCANVYVETSSGAVLPQCVEETRRACAATLADISRKRAQLLIAGC